MGTPPPTSSRRLWTASVLRARSTESRYERRMLTLCTQNIVIRSLWLLDQSQQLLQLPSRMTLHQDLNKLL